MRIYHATDKIHLPGIERLGLLAKLASGRRPAVWAVKAGGIDRAISHCCLKRKVRAADVVILELDVPSSWIKGFSVKGFVYIPRDVPPERIRVYARLAMVKE